MDVDVNWFSEAKNKYGSGSAQPGDGMGELGDSARWLADCLSAGMDSVRSVLAGIPFTDKLCEDSPERRLEEYLRQREWRRKMGMPEPEYEMPDMEEGETPGLEGCETEGETL